jgi:ubiquinone/menaquinone biosynthesis C-methylase UbiE
VNTIHNVICSSGRWRARVERELLPWGLKDVSLGEDVLEIGPGFGATTHVLADRAKRLTVLELDPAYCARLRGALGDRVEVTEGHATSMPYADRRFSAALCFTMLHHVPSVELQDQAFAEIARVLAPGGTFAGTDSVGTGALFKLIHIGDTLVPLDPNTLPDRLAAVGFADPSVEVVGGSMRFRARKP